MKRTSESPRYWIELSTPDELVFDIDAPYRLCFPGSDARFALCTNDAIRFQKFGTPFKATGESK